VGHSKDIESTAQSVLKGEAEGRFRLARDLATHLRNPKIALPVRVLVAAILMGILSYSVLISLFLINALYARVANEPMPTNIYPILFGVITLLLFLCLLVFGRSAVEYEYFSRTEEAFNRAARSRIRRASKK
jgi:hypothetical protein